MMVACSIYENSVIIVKKYYFYVWPLDGSYLEEKVGAALQQHFNRLFSYHVISFISTAYFPIMYIM